MGLRIVLQVHQADDVEFDDIEKLNQELLEETPFGELYDNLDASGTTEPFEGPLKLLATGELMLANRSEDAFEGYDSYTNVWGCYGPTLWGKIAEHVSAGKIVFHLDIEGNPDDYIIITPNNYEVKSESTLVF